MRASGNTTISTIMQKTIIWLLIGSILVAGGVAAFVYGHAPHHPATHSLSRSAPTVQLSSSPTTTPSPAQSTSSTSPSTSAFAPTSLSSKNAPAAPLPQGVSPAAQPFDHILLIVMENTGYAAAIQDPTISALMGDGESATSYYAITHPSLPNYLALTTGSTLGVTVDCWYCYQNTQNLGSQLTSHEISWSAYMQGLQSAGSLTPYDPQTDYAAKHDPFYYFTAIRQGSDRQNIVPLSDFSHLITTHATTFPQFMWVTPNLCYDGHDCSLSTASQWLNNFITSIKTSALWQERPLVIVTWDEGNGADTTGINSAGIVAAENGGGQVLTLFLSPCLAADQTISTPANHYSLLHTIEDIFSVPHLGKSPAGAGNSLLNDLAIHYTCSSS